MPIVLTFDLGTTLFKACLFDNDGRLLAVARLATPADHPQAGWSQIEPSRFDQTLHELVDQLREQDASACQRVGAICFATQTNSMLLLDEHDEPLTPIILWDDRRAEDFHEQLSVFEAEPGFHEQTGIPALSPQFALAKLLWLKQHEPAAWRRARQWRLIGDQLACRLTGRHVTEAGAAGLTGLLDIHQLQWRARAVAAAGLSDVALPTPMRAGADLGVIDRGLADAWRLPRHCRVVLGCLDQYAGAIGAGNVEPGQLSETTGTVLATVSLSSAFDAAPGAGVFQGPAWCEGRWWRMCFGFVSANLLEALREAEPDRPSFAVLEAEAAAVPHGSAGLRLDPVKSQQAGRPVFEKLEAHHTRGHRVRAVYEGVARALQTQVASLTASHRPNAIHAVGGAARSTLWLQIKADTLQIPVSAIDTAEPTSLGAAALALATLTRERLATVAGRIAITRETMRPTGGTSKSERAR
ncbi:MAG: FGGY-family carbohydrate kinase [Phycisphaeraceae bacterium]